MKDIGVLDYVVCGGDKTQNIRNLDAAIHKFFDVSKSRGILNSEINLGDLPIFFGVL